MDSHYDQVMKARQGADPSATRLYFAYSTILDRAAFDAWRQRWTARRADDPRPPEEVAAAMDRVNPVYVPRNHLLEEALAAATAGDLGPFHQLLEVVQRPYDERPGLERYARPAPDDFGPYQTFCGT